MISVTPVVAISGRGLPCPAIALITEARPTITIAAPSRYEMYVNGFRTPLNNVSPRSHP